MSKNLIIKLEQQNSLFSDSTIRIRVSKLNDKKFFRKDSLTFKKL